MCKICLMEEPRPLDSEGICGSCWEEASFDDWEDYCVPKFLRKRWENGERFVEVK